MKNETAREREEITVADVVAQAEILSKKFVLRKFKKLLEMMKGK
jgi:hypothetical protein